MATKKTRGRPPSAVGAPGWFNLPNYSDAANLDAADWYLNLVVRCLIVRKQSDFWAKMLQWQPLIRRGNGIPIEFIGADDEFPSDFIRILGGREPNPSVRMLRCDEVYFFEKRLPEAHRAFGRTFVAGETTSEGMPTGFDGPIDRVFPDPMTRSFVHVDLAFSDAVLVEDFKAFVAAKRKEHAAHPGPQPFRAALDAVESKQDPRTKVWASRQLLAYMDLDAWRLQTKSSLTDAEIQRLLGLTDNLLRQTKRDAEQLCQPFALDAWLLPLARKTVRMHQV